MIYTAEHLADTGYRITVFIPHSATGVNLLKNPANLRFNIAVNDADSAKGRDTQLVWTGTARNWKDPKYFGLLRPLRQLDYTTPRGAGTGSTLRGEDGERR